MESPVGIVQEPLRTHQRIQQEESASDKMKDETLSIVQNLGLSSDEMKDVATIIRSCYQEIY